MKLNAATRLLSANLTRKELLKRAEEKGYKITHKGSGFSIKSKQISIRFNENGTIYIDDMPLAATKNMSLTDAAKALKLM